MNGTKYEVPHCGAFTIPHLHPPYILPYLQVILRLLSHVSYSLTKFNYFLYILSIDSSKFPLPYKFRTIMLILQLISDTDTRYQVTLNYFNFKI